MNEDVDYKYGTHELNFEFHVASSKFEQHAKVICTRCGAAFEAETLNTSDTEEQIATIEAAFEDFKEKFPNTCEETKKLLLVYGVINE